ncbi:zwei Ig domain protein zig-8-like [Macrosteles quadrilineatus]|uniref:zwei Ig domain protein zig-8-like n=1 Tax=Macrosteles quadrilineatus TaxID=74068 RepID=UPI0023E27486|nr:zwei Ig domain protein zig-8-like [Macrosteles quadrilineatus]
MILELVLISLWIHCPSAQNDLSDNDSLYPLWDDEDLSLGEDPPTKDSAPFLNLTVQAGATAILQCAFDDLTERNTVSWLRRHDGQLRLLSVGLEIYSRDPRYTFQRSENNEWQLTIAGVVEDDRGLYECQVTSHPPVTYYRYLQVTVPNLEILDERGLRILSKFYDAGSTLELKCRITRVPRPQHFVSWVHGDHVLNFDIVRGGISVKSEVLADGVKSSLFVANAKVEDSGNYTCALAGVGATTVFVHVIKGETPAAMQHGAASSVSDVTAQLISAMLLLTYTR